MCFRNAFFLPTSNYTATVSCDGGVLIPVIALTGSQTGNIIVGHGQGGLRRSGVRSDQSAIVYDADCIWSTEHGNQFTNCCCLAVHCFAHCHQFQCSTAFTSFCSGQCPHISTEQSSNNSRQLINFMSVHEIISQHHYDAGTNLHFSPLSR